MHHKKTMVFATHIKAEIDSGNKPAYITLLSNEFLKRYEGNQKYSVRAFARDLGLNPGHLRRILFRQRVMRLKTAQAVCEKLDLNKHDRYAFLQSLLYHH